MRLQIADSENALLKKRLRQSDRFAWTLDSQGRTIIYDFTTPERHIRVSETIRILISCFSGNHAAPVSAVVDTFVRRCGTRLGKQQLATILSTIQKLTSLGVLTPQREARGVYTKEMASYYAQSRRIPKAVGATIVRAGKIHQKTRVLDIGTGTGSLAMHLAEVSANVIGIDVSRPFLTLASNTAKSRGLKAKFIVEDANKLVFQDSEYDIVVVSQAFHWLDPSWATRGINHNLRPDGQLFVLESKPVLAARHPFRTLLGYGRESHLSVLKECVRHAKQYVGLFSQLQSQQFHLVLTENWIFRQQRRFDMNFAHAYFLPDQLRTAMANERSPRTALKGLLAKESPETLSGYMYWLLLCFEKRDRSMEKQPKRIPITLDIIDIPDDDPST
jgi:ubiquinone/menaquinone biosynthesis C-methylase UbiE